MEASDKEKLRHLLGQRLRFTLSDGRVVVGVFQCMDRLQNFVVARATETRLFERTDGSGSEERKRELGAVLVPGKHLARVEAPAARWAEAEARVTTLAGAVEPPPLEGLSLSGVALGQP